MRADKSPVKPIDSETCGCEQAEYQDDKGSSIDSAIRIQEREREQYVCKPMNYDEWQNAPCLYIHYAEQYARKKHIDVLPYPGGAQCGQIPEMQRTPHERARYDCKDLALPQQPS